MRIMKAVAAVVMALFVGVTTHAAESDETVTLMAGQSASYTTTTKAQQWTCKTSGDGSVVTAQATGGKFSLGSRVETLTITGTGAGSVKVDLYRGLTGGTLVKTIYVTVTKIQQTGAAQTLHVGETASPTCTAPYGSAWSASSSNPSVATVSVSGSGTSATPTITAVNEGSATVTVENGSASGHLR